LKPVIEVKNLSVRYADRQVLTDISFEIYPNQITVILGKSGCGKTTVLKHLMGLYQPKTGSIKIFDYILNNISEAAYEQYVRKIGVLFQNSALLNSLSVAENIAVPMEQNTQMTAEMIDYLVRIKLQLVDLSDAYLLYPSQLSGGMRKRVALARALALDPPLVFCDEPSAGLDPLTLRSLNKLFIKLRDKLNITLVLVTHEVLSILELSDRIIFLDEGKVVFSGSLQEASRSGIIKIEKFFEAGSANFNSLK
jgi:phospholipid/cholesterol/gamma-HCH transport system ATP-binding protein